MDIGERHSLPGTRSVRGRIIALYAGLIAFNLALWAWALIACRGRYVLLGTAAAAYAFGLRHAVDADHIAAIDNVTRKLTQERQRPLQPVFRLVRRSRDMFALGALFTAGMTLIARSGTTLPPRRRTYAQIRIV